MYFRLSVHPMAVHPYSMISKPFPHHNVLICYTLPSRAGEGTRLSGGGDTTERGRGRDSAGDLTSWQICGKKSSLEPHMKLASEVVDGKPF
jgi:hypothetical protein